MPDRPASASIRLRHRLAYTPRLVHYPSQNLFPRPRLICRASCLSCPHPTLIYQTLLAFHPITCGSTPVDRPPARSPRVPPAVAALVVPSFPSFLVSATVSLPFFTLCYCFPVVLMGLLFVVEVVTVSLHGARDELGSTSRGQRRGGGASERRAERASSATKRQYLVQWLSVLPVV